MPLVHRAYAPLKRLLPPTLARPIRGIATALLTPLAWSRTTGHWRSALLGRAVDARGSPLPWYTYPAIDLLRAADLSGCRVLEFGAGQSTLWWAARVRSVLALEDDPTWLAELRPRLPPNAEVRPAAAHAPAAALGPDDGPFDVIVIDGLDRALAVRLALKWLADNGLIIFDNSEGGWPSLHLPADAPGHCELLAAAGFMRLDLYGHAPGVILPHCTSLFWRDNCRLFVPSRRPVQG